MRKIVLALSLGSLLGLAACDNVSYGARVGYDPFLDYDYGYRTGIYVDHHHHHHNRPDRPARPDRPRPPPGIGGNRPRPPSMGTRPARPPRGGGRRMR